MKTRPYLGKQELIALVRDLAKGANVKGSFRKYLGQVLREASRQDRERIRKAEIAKKRREKNKRQRLKVCLREERKRKREQEKRDKWYKEQAKKQEARHAAWRKRYGDCNIETIFGIPIKLEPEAAIPAPIPYSVPRLEEEKT